jgi:GNAT superfamily N-acetyltransferase
MYREIATDTDKGYFRNLNELCYRQIVTEQYGAWNKEIQDKYFSEKWENQAFEKIIDNEIVVGGIWTQEFDNYIKLREILIHPNYQGQGIGTNILLEEIDRAKRSGKEIRLRALLKNRVYNLYKRLGFMETDRDENHFYMVYYT